MTTDLKHIFFVLTMLLSRFTSQEKMGRACKTIGSKENKINKVKETTFILEIKLSFEGYTTRLSIEEKLDCEKRQVL